MQNLSCFVSTGLLAPRNNVPEIDFFARDVGCGAAHPCPHFIFVGKEGALQVMIDEGKAQLSFSIASIHCVDRGQGIQADEAVVAFIHFIGLERRFVAFPEGESLQVPPVIKVVKRVFNIGTA